jgi:hypothetical protein
LSTKLNAIIENEDGVEDLKICYLLYIGVLQEITEILNMFDITGKLN